MLYLDEPVFGIFALGFTIKKKTFALFVGLIFFIVLSFLTHTDTGQVSGKFFLTT